MTNEMIIGLLIITFIGFLILFIYVELKRFYFKKRYPILYELKYKKEVKK